MIEIARRIDEFETWLMLDEDDRPEVWTHWGSQTRRVRFRADTVKITWKREGLSEWLIWEIWVHGKRIHAQTNHSLSKTYTGHGAEKDCLPEWLVPLVEMTNPNLLAGVLV